MSKAMIYRCNNCKSDPLSDTDVVGLAVHHGGGPSLMPPADCDAHVCFSCLNGFLKNGTALLRNGGIFYLRFEGGLPEPAYVASLRKTAKPTPDQ